MSALNVPRALCAITLSMAALSVLASTPENTSKVARATLDNGLKVIVVPNPMAPTVTTIMNYHVGSHEAPAGFPGMAHAQEHMMFRGAKGLSADQISAIAAAMGGDFNADTQQDVTQYFFTVPSQYMDVALNLEAVRMRSVLDSDALWHKERGAIEKEVGRDLSAPTYVVYTKLLKRMFAGTPYADDALGSKASFDKTTGAMLKSFYDKWYTPNNATLIISGDVDPTQALVTVKKLFADIPAHDLPKRPEIKLQAVDTTAIHTPTDQPYGLAFLAYRLPGFSSDDYAATQVLAQVLSNHRGPLYSQLVPTGKALDAGFELDGMRPAGIGFGAVAFAPGADTKDLTKHARKILQTIGKKGVDADLVTAAKRQLATQEEASKDSISGLAMHWSQAVVVEEKESPAARLHAVQQVSVDDVNRVARKYLKSDSSVLAVLSPQGSGAPSSGQGFGGQESFTPSHVKSVSLPDWAAKPLAKIEAPTSIVNPRVTTLDNGLKIIVQPETSSQAVHVYGHIRNQADLQTPPGKEGVGQVLDTLLGYGTKSLDRSEYQAALDNIGARASAGTQFSLTVLRSHLDQGMQLLAENELQPRLPKKLFKIVQRQVAGAVAGQIQSPDFHLHQGLKAALYPSKDPSLRHATPNSVAGLKYVDVTNYYHQVFRPDLATIVIIGNVDPKQAAAIVKSHFGDWKAKGKTPNVDLDSVAPNKPSVVHVPDRSKSQDHVVMVETVGLTAQDDDYNALKLGNQVLSGGFYSSRLYRELRAERGLVYYIQSGFNLERKRTTLHLAFGANPAQANTASQLIQQALEKMQKQPISAEELHRAQAALVRQVALKESSANNIGHGFLQLTDLGLPLDKPVRDAQYYLELSAKDVQTAYKKWIRPHDMVRASEGPKPAS